MGGRVLGGMFWGVYLHKINLKELLPMLLLTAFIGERSRHIGLKS